MKKHLFFSVILLMFFASMSFAADTVPPVIDLPGTQPGEVGNLESPDKCDNCHGGYNPSVEPAHNWRGSMMGNAGRDPIFWATLAIAEQDFDGAGDLCIRCHSTAGWLAGRSTPTDGSGLAASGDDDGVECDFCHKMTRPDDTQLLGVQLDFFPANDPITGEGFYGSGMSSLWGGNEKLGPYIDAEARHQFIKNPFIRDPEFCGTCHDVSNSAVGHFAPNFGAQTPENVVTNGTRLHSSPDHILGTQQRYVALNNPPYAYGVVERTFSEHMSSDVPTTAVRDFATLPADLQDGSFKAIYESALVAGTNGDYADGQTRFYTCQSCHLRPVNGPGCNKAGVPIRTDLALHDMTGGNYWMGEAIKYQDAQGTIRLGGGLSATQIAAIDDGMIRARKQLNQAASLEVIGNTLKVTNLTGHKVITGYPEGRRMWLNIKWYDSGNVLIGEDGAYGTINVTHRGQQMQVASLIDPYDANSKVYEAHYGMTQEWANTLMSLGYSSDFPLGFDRYTGAVDYTLGMLNAGAPGSAHETFHFVLNNVVVKDNRIPPFGMRFDDAKLRNALPVPVNQYGGGTTGSVYDYFDNFTLNPPAGAVYAAIDLMYQTTSWEYMQFLDLANNQQNEFLGQEGVNMLEAWLNTGMAAPYTMVSAVWGTPPTPQVDTMTVDSLSTWSVSKQGNLVVESSTFSKRDTVAVVAHVDDDAGLPLSGAQVFVEVLTDPGGALKVNLQGFTDETGTAILNWKTGRNDVGTYTANVTTVLKNGYEYDPAGSVTVTAPFTVN